MTYRLPAAGLSWSLVFKALESNKERLHIIDCSISQTSLEQVSMCVRERSGCNRGGYTMDKTSNGRSMA